MQDTYAEAVNVLERLTHLKTNGIQAVQMKLPAAEHRLGYLLCASNGEIDCGSIAGARFQRHVRMFVGPGRDVGPGTGCQPPDGWKWRRICRA